MTLGFSWIVPPFMTLNLNKSMYAKEDLGLQIIEMLDGISTVGKTWKTVFNEFRIN